MRFISCKLEDLKRMVLPIGYEGENDHTRVQVDAGEVFKEYPAAVPTLKVHGPTGAIYPAEVTRDGKNVIWDIKASDCAADGSGEAQFTFTLNNVIVKSCIAKIKVYRSIVGGSTPPDPVQDWLDEAQDVLDDLEAAEVHQPMIGVDGYWYTWDQENEEYTKTETKAQGEDGQPGPAGQDGAPGQDATPALITVNYSDLTFPVAKDTQCYHDGLLYYAKQDIQTSEAWTAAHWQQTTVEEQQRLLLTAIQGAENIIDTVFYPDHTALFEVGSMNTTKGTEVASTTRFRTGYLPEGVTAIIPDNGYKYMLLAYVKNDESYKGAWNGNQFVKNGNWLTNGFLIPIRVSNDYYYRILGAKSDDSNVDIQTDAKHINIIWETDRTLTKSGIPADAKVVGELINNLTADVINPLFFYKSHNQESIPIGQSALSYSDFISNTWEAFKTAFSDIVTRNVLINDTSDTYPIYEYVVTPSEYYTHTVLMAAGMHGDEYEGFWSLYRIMNFLYTMGYKYEKTRNLLRDTKFIIIPVLNPYGVQNRTRGNSAGVNAHENYDVRWNDNTYSRTGTTPFQYNESKAVKLALEAHNDVEMFIEFHTDPYDPDKGNYTEVIETSPLIPMAYNITLDERQNLKNEYNYVYPLSKDWVVYPTKKCNSIRYVEEVWNIPALLMETGIGGAATGGTATQMEIAFNWYINCMIQAIKTLN